MLNKLLKEKKTETNQNREIIELNWHKNRLENSKFRLIRSQVKVREYKLGKNENNHHKNLVWRILKMRGT